jgi:hypothetical protein
MRQRVVKKEPGCSWIEVNKKVHTYLVVDKSHPQTHEIYAELERLIKEPITLEYGITSSPNQLSGPLL